MIAAVSQYASKSAYTTDMVPWGLLHVYDFMEGWDTSRETAEPTKHEKLTPLFNILQNFFLQYKKYSLDSDSI